MTSRLSTRAQVLALLACLAAVFVTGAIGAIASMDAASFYARLARPDWAPRASVFGPVWTALYALMGVAAWLVWRRARSNRVALGLFAVQLAANALWSWLFFAWHLGAWAFADILLLIALVIATTLAFARTSRLAALLLLPYLAWVCFAAVLSWTIWRANPGLL